MLVSEYYIGEDEVQEHFAKSFTRIKYIKIIPFGVILLLGVFSMGIIFYFHASKLSSTYIQPIKNAAEAIRSINLNQIEDQEDNLFVNQEQHFGNSDIQEIYDNTIALIKIIKFSKQKYLKDDALGLLELTKAKSFYSMNGNIHRAGICCNNIGNIHLKHNRYYEAVAEYQEGILLAKIDCKQANDKIRKLGYDPQPTTKFNSPDKDSQNKNVIFEILT